MWVYMYFCVYVIMRMRESEWVCVCVCVCVWVRVRVRERERERERESSTHRTLFHLWDVWEWEWERERERERELNSQNTLSSVRCFMTNHIPAGNMQTSMWRSKKKEVHVVGWCSDTLAMMGMWIFAYLQVCRYVFIQRLGCHGFPTPTVFPSQALLTLLYALYYILYMYMYFPTQRYQVSYSLQVTQTIMAIFGGY